MIQIIYGSIFDHKCDLLIIPCDSAGGVTSSIFRNISNNKMPYNIGPISFGQVIYYESINEFANSIGYAASVDALSLKSDIKIIKKIANTILEYSRQNQIHIVNIPLLGSGAGGLNHIDSYKTLKEVFSKEDEITFNIFCFTKDVYKAIEEFDDDISPEMIDKPPRVFISYTRYDKENEKWVKTLADELRKNGINARLDLYHLKPGFDLPQWMTNEVIMAEKVLLICDKYYVEKANFRKGGVGWETMIIQGDMLAQGDYDQKYIAICREKSFDEALPIYLKSKYALNWGSDIKIDEEKLKELIMHIFECDLEPELGPIPDFVKDKRGK